MAWISVHQDVDGTKLRRLYKAIGCSKFEALGILNFLWFWGLKNADETGMAQDADLDVLGCYLVGSSENPSFDAGLVTDALVETGWIDMDEHGFRIHDWDVWQEQWYKLQRTRKYDAERKRKAYQQEKTGKAPAPVVQPEKQPEAPAKPDTPTDTPADTPPEKPRKPKKPAEKKVKYADFVRMTEAEHEKLVVGYGAKFTAACIAKLDSYKGQNNKRYASDYRAILNWVVNAVKEKNPGLMEMSMASVSTGKSSNPFED